MTGYDIVGALTLTTLMLSVVVTVISLYQTRIKKP